MRRAFERVVWGWRVGWLVGWLVRQVGEVEGARLGTWSCPW